MEESLKKIIAVAENLDWNADFNEDDSTIEFQRYSTLGKDFSFYVEIGATIEDTAHNIYDYAESFDPEEESLLWVGPDGHGKNGAPYHLKDIIEDMEECQTNIYTLAQEILN